MDEDDYDDNEFCRPNKAVNNHHHQHQVPMINMVANPSMRSILGGHAIELDDDDDGNMSKKVEFQRNKATDHDHLLMKSQIANHPAYPHLLGAYIQCKKVGAPPDTASVLEEIGQSRMGLGSCSDPLGADPELDYFMESYCEVLQRFKEEFCKPLNEATAFLCNIESQLSHLCQGTSIPKPLDFHPPSASGNYNIISEEHDHQVQQDEEDVMNNDDDDDDDRGEIGFGVRSGVEDYYQQELKEKLLRKYSGYLTMLKTEFLKKRKKVELPKPAKSTLLQWWNLHSRWPYPTEEEKVKLSEETGLDQKQINNWFVNQRKRHWKPTEDIKSALINNQPANE